MWIGEDGAVNVEAIWDDPWSIFDRALEGRVRGLSALVVNVLDQELFAAQMDVMLDIHEAFADSPRELERQFERREIEREPVLVDHPDLADVAAVLLLEIARVEARWRPDAIFAAVAAVGQLLPE